MYGVGGSQAISRDSNLLFSPSFKHSDGEFLKSRDFIDSDMYQNQHSSGLMRYRSAPSSLFASLVDGGGCEGFLNHHEPSIPESESVFTRFESSNGSDDSEPLDLQFAVKHETPEQNQNQNQYSGSDLGHVIYRSSLDHGDLANRRDSVSNITSNGLFKVANGSAMENPVEGKNLIRQSSSPAGLFKNLTVENGFAVMRDAGNFRVGNGTNGKASPTKRLNDHINFSSGPPPCSRFMPQIGENGNESSSPENGHLVNGNSTNGIYVPSSQNDTGFTGVKRNRDGEESFSGFNAFENQNWESRNYGTGLTHHLSLPKTSAEMGAVEKFLQFQQDSVPCKIRAKRGFATHPRSIAERMRRTRISERMRKLQDLFPNMDKQTNTADMLDLAVDYIKDLQKQVKTLADTKAKCTCSSKQKQPSNRTV